MKKFICSTLIATTLLTTNVFADDFVEAVPISQPIISTNAIQQQVLTLTNTTTLNVTPDIANINVYIRNEATTSSEAKNLTDTDVANITNILVNSGLCSESDISSNNFSIYQNYSYDQNTGASTPDGYVVEAGLTISLKNADDTKLNQALNLITQIDTASVTYISYDSSKYDEYYNKALVQAINATTDRANYVSNAIFNGATVSILNVTENSGYINTYTDSDTYEFAKVADTNYMPSQIGVSATATVTFGLN